MQNKLLVMGGTGALAAYLVPTMLDNGWLVDVVSLDDMVSDREGLRYFKFNCKDIALLSEQLKNNYDAIIDFMVYFSPEEFGKYYKLFLENTRHYVYLSSYRIYADSDKPITEESARLLDEPPYPELLTSGDYCIYKAQGEDMLRASGYNNWTILRPAITYSKRRFQLVTLEAEVLIWRMLRGKTVLVPEPALDIPATMSWSGDFARMVSRLFLNPKAFGEAFTISTSETHTWREIAQMYAEIGGLKILPVDTETFLNMIVPEGDDRFMVIARQQLILDRYYRRVIDNSKVLNATGLTQDTFMPLYEGLKGELSRLDPNSIRCNEGANARMDAYLEKLGMI